MTGSFIPTTRANGQTALRRPRGYTPAQRPPRDAAPALASRPGSPRRFSFRRLQQGALERFPVTIVLGLEYGWMVVYPALLHHTQPERLMVSVCAVAVGLAFVVEFLLAWLPRRPAMRPSPAIDRRLATWVLLIGAVAQLGLVLGGNVSYATQSTGGSRSHFASVVSPLTPWLMFGAVLYLWLWRQGKVRRSTVFLVFGFVAVVELAVLRHTAATAALASLALTLLFASALLGFIRLRWVALIIALIPIVWPPLYAFRNDLRHQQVETYSATGAPSASQRLREDLNFARIELMPIVPDPALTPSALRVVQFGLLPSAVDPGRGVLNTPGALTVAIGGPPTSASTFTTLGGAFALDGWPGVILFTVPVTLAMAWALRRRTVWGYLVAAVLVSDGLWIESTFPDSVAATLQACISLIAVAILAALLSRRSGRATRRTAAPQVGPPEAAAAPDWALRGRTPTLAPTPALAAGRSSPAAPMDLAGLWDGEPPSPRALLQGAQAYPGSGGPTLRRTIRDVAALNLLGSAASAIGGLLAARYLGAFAKGEFAAAMSWFAVSLVVGELGQQASIVYFVAHEPRRGRDFLTTSRNIMLLTGLVAATFGILLAPTLAGGRGTETLAFRILFASAPLAFVTASYTFALQAKNIRRWIVTTLVQPVAYLVLIVAAILAHHFGVVPLAVIVVVSTVLQAGFALRGCRREQLLGGSYQWQLGKRVVAYGSSQLLSTTPTTVNTNLDQLILSQTVPNASLGRYSLAASLTTVASPLVAPIGSVLFPRLAAGRDTPEASRRIQFRAVFATVLVAALLMGALAAVASQLVPLVFGHSFQGAVPLIWILAPSGVFLGANRVIADLLRGHGRPLSVAIAQGIGAVLTIVLLIILVPSIGARGAAITTTVAYGITTIVMLVLLTRQAAAPSPPVQPPVGIVPASSEDLLS